MALLAATELEGKYRWTAIKHSDPRVSGEPDRTAFTRDEGFEVLYFVNKVADILGLTKKADGLKIEEMLKVAPSDLLSQVEVKEWVEANWVK